MSELARRKANLRRNDPRWAGNGKKYKRCHMRLDRTPNRQEEQRS